MKRLLFLIFILLSDFAVQSQNFELIDRQESYFGGFSQLVRIPLKVKNNTEKAQFYVIRKAKSDLLENQKGYFCLDSKCLEPSINEFSKKVEPGETINLYYTIESGMQQAVNNFKFEIFPKGAPAEQIEHNVIVTIDEHQRSVYQSREITINDVYPNPVQDQAIIDYKIHGDGLKAKIVVHNVLGRAMAEYELPSNETRIKMLVDDFAPGVYFYTVYLNNSGVLTRKIMVRK